jgi:hypothetical protein
MLFPEPATQQAVHQTEAIKGKMSVRFPWIHSREPATFHSSKVHLGRTISLFVRVEDRMRCCDLWKDQEEIAML